MIFPFNTMELKAGMVIVMEPIVDRALYQIQDHVLVTEDGRRLLSDKYRVDELFVIE